VADLGEVIAGEHRVVVGLLDDLGTDRRDRFPLAHRLIDELAAHLETEQQLVHPALRDVVPGGIEMANQAQTEHRALRAALEGLERSHPGEPTFEEALVTIRAELAIHVPPEEDEVLPALRAVIGTDKMVELGGLYVAIKDSLPSGLAALSADMSGPEFRRS
jgi:hypothetical protein